MKGRAPLFSHASEEWGTPLDFYRQLDEEFHFTLDPCTTADNPLGTAKFYTKEQNGLEQTWGVETVFINPPYGKGVIDWIRRAYDHECGSVVMLLPARTDTRWYHTYIWDSKNHRFYPWVSGRFLRGRLRFRGASSSAPFPSMIVVFR